MVDKYRDSSLFIHIEQSRLSNTNVSNIIFLHLTQNIVTIIQFKFTVYIPMTVLTFKIKFENFPTVQT